MGALQQTKSQHFSHGYLSASQHMWYHSVTCTETLTSSDLSACWHASSVSIASIQTLALGGAGIYICIHMSIWSDLQKPSRVWPIAGAVGFSALAQILSEEICCDFSFLEFLRYLGVTSSISAGGATKMVLWWVVCTHGETSRLEQGATVDVDVHVLCLHWHVSVFVKCAPLAG